MNDEWMDITDDEKTLNGRLSQDVNTAFNTNYSHNVNRPSNAFLNSFLGPNYALQFAFGLDDITVYLMYKDGSNEIARFTPYFDISNIKTIQVSGDVEKTTEVSFTYN